MSRNKFFTPAQANATLPLVGRIVADIAELARGLREKHQRFRKLTESSSSANEDEMFQLETELEQGRGRMEELETELADLGVLLKDYFIGLIDFPCWRDGREIYLCWKLGEPEVAHWHETDAGFSGRRKLMTEAQTK